MQAGAEGAGPERAIGISIRLPFEEQPNDLLVGGDRVVAMKYFFTRKLMLIKESHAFVCLPGGFGTQDETFELLTLLQTGQGDARPGRAARRSRRDVLDPLGRVRRLRAGRQGPRVPRRPRALLRHRRRRRGGRRHPALLAQLPLDPVGRRSAGGPAPLPADGRRGGRPQRSLRRPAARRRHRGHRAAARPRSPTATSSISRASRCGTTLDERDACAASSTPSTTCRVRGGSSAAR